MNCGAVGYRVGEWYAQFEDIRAGVDGRFDNLQTRFVIRVADYEKWYNRRVVEFRKNLFIRFHFQSFIIIRNLNSICNYLILHWSEFFNDTNVFVASA